MPEPPPGEDDLGALARRFEDVERRVRALIARAPEGDRRKLLTEALNLLVALRREDFRGPVISAYLAFKRGGDAGAVADLAGSLAKKLDRAAQTASANAREAFTKVTQDNVEELANAGVVAHEDDRGTRWALASYAALQTATLGRAASSRGVRDSKPKTVTIEVSGCPYCQEFEGTYAIAEVPGWPPFHPSCTCVASAA